MANNIYFNIIVCLLLLFAFYKIAFVKIIYELKQARYLKHQGIRTTGKIINIEESKDSDGLKMYRPVIEYITFDHRTLSFIPVDAKMSKPILNSDVPVIYDKSNPQMVIIDRKSAYRFIIIKFLIILIVFSFLIFIFLKNSFFR